MAATFAAIVFHRKENLFQTKGKHLFSRSETVQNRCTVCAGMSHASRKGAERLVQRPCTNPEKPTNQMSGIPAASHSARISSDQMLAWISPMCPLWSNTMHRRLCPIPPPMLKGSWSPNNRRWK